MSDVDRYEVENLIRDARAEVRGEIDREVNRIRQAIWADVKLEVNELRNEVKDLQAALADELEALQRVIDARTGHLA